MLVITITIFLIIIIISIMYIYIYICIYSIYTVSEFYIRARVGFYMLFQEFYMGYCKGSRTLTHTHTHGPFINTKAADPNSKSLTHWTFRVLGLGFRVCNATTLCL